MDNVGGVNHSEDSRITFEDPTGKIITAIGIGLLIAFIFPILVPGYRTTKLVFLNIEILGARGASGMLIIQCLYPLIAGLAAIFLAKRERSGGKAFALLAIGLLPFLILLASRDVQRAFGQITRNLPGGLTIGLSLVLGTIAVFSILSGAHAARVKPANQLAGYVAAIGAGLYFLTLLIPTNGEFSFIIPFKLMGARDPSGMGIMFLSGLVTLICLVLMIIASVRCFMLLKQEGEEKARFGKSIIRLWFAQLYVYGAFILYIIIASAGQGRGDGGIVFFTLLMSIIKFVPWILGLYLLIPLGISEFILLHSTPAPAAPQE